MFNHSYALTHRAERTLRLDTRHHSAPLAIVDALSSELGPSRAVLLHRDPRGEWRAEAPLLRAVRVVREAREEAL